MDPTKKIKQDPDLEARDYLGRTLGESMVDLKDLEDNVADELVPSSK